MRAKNFHVFTKKSQNILAKTLLTILIVSFYLFTNYCFVFSKETRVLSNKNIYLEEKFSKAVKFHKTGQLEKATEIYDQLIETNKTAQARKTLYFNRGLALRDSGYFRSAIDDFSKALFLDPKNDVLYFNRGIAYLKISEYKKALKDFDLTISLVPGDVKAIHNRALTKYWLFDLQGALRDAEQARKYWNKLAETEKSLEAKKLIELINLKLHQKRN